MAARLHRANVWSAATPVDPIRYYDVGGANLDPAVSTDDYYHMNGLYWLRPYDLRKWGSHGAAMETARGGRYVWACGADHPTSLTWAWRDSAEWMIGFTNDPGVFPATMMPVIPWNNQNTGIIPGAPANEHGMYEQCWLVYNPEDPDGLVFYLNGEGSGGGIGHANNLWRSNDLINWTVKLVSHVAALDNNQWSSFQVTRRIGAGNWQSHGVGGTTSYNGTYKWTSTDGRTYTIGSTSLKRYRKTDGTLYNQPEIIALPHTYDPTISDIYYGVGDEFSVSGQRSWVCKEYVGVWEGSVARPQYLSIVPVDADGGILATPAPNRIADYGLRKFPGPSEIQEAPYLEENGILHIYVAHGFPGQADTNSNGFPYCTKWDTKPADGVLVTFSGITRVTPLRPFCVTISSYWSNVQQIFHDNGAGVFVGARIVSSAINYATGAWGVVFNAAPDNLKNVSIRYVENNTTFTAETGNNQDGGGLVEQFHDYWTYIYDATAAAAHAPVGVTASCAAGTVTISWYDALPHQSYRVYKGSTATTQTTLVANVTGLSTTDTPASGQQWWYKVVTLNSGTESGYRVVHCYASSASELANRHINRVIDDGGDVATINVARLGSAIAFLTAQGWLNDLLFWASPDWGVKQSGGHITKVYCLGTTRLPRGGDLTFSTINTTYDATGLNGSSATFSNNTNNAFGYFGGNRFNPIRKKRQITVAAMYARTQTSTDITFLGMRTSNGNIDNNYVGAEQPGLSFSHLAGTPGTIEFSLKDDNFGTGARQNVATATATSTSYNIAIGAYDGSAMKAYHNGSAGSANLNYDPNPFHTRDTVLAGAKGGSAAWPVLGVGSRNCSYTAPTNPPVRTAGTYVFPANEAQFKASDLFVMARGVDSAGAMALNNLLVSFAGARKYLIEDFAAEGDGVNDDGPELNTAGAYFAALPGVRGELVINSGHTFNVSTGQFWTTGVRDLVVTGTGAIVHVVDPLGVYDFGSGVVGRLDAGSTVPIDTLAAGATTANMKHSADASKLTVGAYVCLCGLCTQDEGSPANRHLFEYIKVAGVSGTTVTFDRPVRNTYLDSWPDKGAASLLVTEGVDLGAQGWDQHIEHYDYTVTQPVGGHSRSRDIRLHDMALSVFTPTNSDTILLDNCTLPSSSIEVDKLVSVWRCTNSTIRRMFVQSSAPALLYLDGTALTATGGTKSLDGTPRHTVITNGCNITRLSPGCFYGVIKSLKAENSIISEWEIGAAAFDRGGDSEVGVQVAYTMSGGIITIPRSSRPTNLYPAWAIPGTVAFFGGKYPYEKSFEIDAITADATNLYVHTSLAGGFPTVPLDGSSRLLVNVHPCPKLTVTNCSGSALSVDLSGAPAGQPLGSWSRRSYTALSTGAMQAAPFVMGRVVEIRVNVTTAFTGTGGDLKVRVMDAAMLDAAGTEVRYEPVIDLLVAGERVITPSGVTGTAGGDSGLALATGAWFTGSFFAGFNAFRDVSGQAGVGPAVTVTIVTDQEAAAVDDPDYAALVAMAEALAPTAIEPPPDSGGTLLFAQVLWIGYKG